jgi:hypothetical protein
MPQDAPRNDVPPYDGLLDFGSEAPNSPLDTKEPDVALNRDEPDSALDHGSEPAVIFEIALNRQERDITSDTRKPDTQPDAYMRPPHEPLGQPFVWYTSDSDPVVHRSARRKMGIALLMLAGIGALAWWGRSFIEMGRDAGTSGTQIQNAPQPTATVPPDAPTNISPPGPPPAPEPQAPVADLPAEAAAPSEPATAIATPSEAPRANEPAPRAERPARQAEQLTVKTDPNAAGGLFAITRPLGAQVFVDNKLIGTTPLFMSQLSSGSHEVRLELPGFRPHSSKIQVEPNKRFRLAVQLDETR